MSSDFERIRQEFGFPGDDRVIAKCFLLWAGVVGAISLEVFGQYGADTLTDPEAVFDTQVRLLVDVLTQRMAAVAPELERVHPTVSRPDPADHGKDFPAPVYWPDRLGYPARR